VHFGNIFQKYLLELQSSIRETARTPGLHASGRNRHHASASAIYEEFFLQINGITP